MEIVWTEFAYDTLFETLLFVRKKWSHRVVWGVRKAIYDKVLSLKNFPLQGEKVIVECREEVDVRILLVNKRTKIFYFIYSEKVYIVMVWDVRRDTVEQDNKLRFYLRRYLR
jgi:hypothetical protein